LFDFFKNLIFQLLKGLIFAILVLCFENSKFCGNLLDELSHFTKTGKVKLFIVEENNVASRVTSEQNNAVVISHVRREPRMKVGGEGEREKEKERCEKRCERRRKRCERND
jgi:hypothetical protein